MSKIIIASINPVKIKATLNGFKKMFPEQTFTVNGLSASSNVSDQPKSDTETWQGAMNRVNNVLAQNLDADFYVGIEGGIEDREGQISAFAWIIIKSKDGRLGQGKTGTFFLPPKVSELIKQGKELGEADDIVFGRRNSKQANGAVGILTGDVADRTKYYTEAVILALIPFKNKNLYFNL